MSVQSVWPLTDYQKAVLAIWYKCKPKALLAIIALRHLLAKMRHMSVCQHAV